MPTIQGGCFCGAVRYEATGAPSNSTICHCQSCRRIAAAPVVAWITIERSAFRLLKGELTTFQSSPGVKRTFCATCGTPLTYESNKFPSTIDITTCSLDDANAVPPDHHAWTRDDLQWARFGDSLPQFPQFRPDA